MIAGYAFAAITLVIGLGGGVYLLFFEIKEFTEWRKMGDWSTTSATIRELGWVNIASHRGSKLRCVYEYEIAGTTHKGERVFAIHAIRPNYARCDEKVFEALNKAWTRGESVRCFVDPADPESAVLIRAFQPGQVGYDLMLAISLLVTGTAGPWFFLYLVQGARKRLELARRHPDQPWRWRDSWVGTKLLPENREVSPVAWFTGMGLTCASVPAAGLALPTLLRFGGSPGSWLMVIVLSVLGPIVLMITMVVNQRWRRFCYSFIELQQVPIPPGDYIVGEIVIVPGLRGLQWVKAELTCRRSEYKKFRVVEEVLYRDAFSFELSESHLIKDGVRIPFSIETPFYCPASNDDATHRVEWLLKLRSQRDGGGLKLDFHVPVFNEEEQEQ